MVANERSSISSCNAFRCEQGGILFPLQSFLEKSRMNIAIAGILLFDNRLGLVPMIALFVSVPRYSFIEVVCLDFALD